MHRGKASGANGGEVEEVQGVENQGGGGTRVVEQVYARRRLGREIKTVDEERGTSEHGIGANPWC